MSPESRQSSTSLYPDLPSISDSGLSGYEAVSTYGVFSPAKTPASILQRLNVEIVKLLNESKIKDKLRASGSESVGTSPKVLTDRIRADILRFSKILKYEKTFITKYSELKLEVC